MTAPERLAASADEVAVVEEDAVRGEGASERRRADEGRVEEAADGRRWWDADVGRDAEL